MNAIDRRSHFRENLNPLYLPKYDLLCSKLPLTWAPYSAYRSFSQQDDLFAQGRTSNGLIVTNARGGESSHNYGCASDWCWIDNGQTVIWLKDDDPKWQEYLDAIEAVGLRNGLAYGDIDHVELKISIKYSELLPYYNQGGMAAVNFKISSCML